MTLLEVSSIKRETFALKNRYKSSCNFSSIEAKVVFTLARGGLGIPSAGRVALASSALVVDPAVSDTPL